MSHISSKVVATTSFILSSNIIQNGDIHCPGKWPFNERCHCIAISVISKANVSPIPCIRL